MKINLLHAHFLVSIGDYSNERIGFTVELEENETINEAVAQLREKAIAAVGPKASTLYGDKRELQDAVYALEKQLQKLRQEWDATADFLKAQGIRADAPSMPQFRNLLAAAVEGESVVQAEFADTEDDGEDHIF